MLFDGGPNGVFEISMRKIPVTLNTKIIGMIQFASGFKI